MAEIIIREVDYTTSEAYSPTETIVYIPGMIGNDAEGNIKPAGEVLGKPKLVNTVADFEELFGVSPRIISNAEASEVEYDKSFVMAKQLVASGMPVLYEVVGNNGEEVTTKDAMIAVLKTNNFWTKLADRSIYNPRFITSGAYNAIGEDGDVAAATAMTEFAGKRGDCVALIDHAIGLADVAAIKNLFNGAGIKSLAFGTYGTAFTPWCKFDLTADFNNVVQAEGEAYWTLPGSFAYLLAYNAMLNNYATWFAAAGKVKGMIPLLREPLVDFGEIACNELQLRTEGSVAVNPITWMNPYGYRIYGNRTLKQNAEGLKAQSFLNIRNLCSDIKKVCFQACRQMAFEQNTDVLWYNLKSKITPTLNKMKTGEGIRDFKITRINTGEKAKVVAKIRILPIEAVEDFDITIELADSLETIVETE